MVSLIQRCFDINYYVTFSCEHHVTHDWNKIHRKTPHGETTKQADAENVLTVVTESVSTSDCF